MGKYHYEQTGTDARCLNEKGAMMMEEMEMLDRMKGAARFLASDLDFIGWHGDATDLRRLADSLAAASQNIENELEEG